MQALIAGASLGAPGLCAGAGRPVTVAAASSLRHVLPAIAQQNPDTGSRARFIFGASGNLYRQLRQGAPFGVFLSANAAFADDLVNADLTNGPAVSYATGRLAVLVRNGARNANEITAENLAEVLLANRNLTVAIANPNHAPYGKAARQALETLRLTDALGGRIRIGENAAQAAQFVLSGGVDVALVPLSLALAPGVARRARYTVLDSSLHAELDQRMVLMSNATTTEAGFFLMLQKPAAHAAFQQGGLGPPTAL